MDILFHTDEYVFSYRIAGICVKNGTVLLQTPLGKREFAFPGGHSAFGETNAETLIREFKEEIGADISVGELKWVGEMFFPCGDKPCHQICLYYDTDILSADIPTEGMFYGKEEIEGHKFKLEFHWIPIDELSRIEVYPTNAPELMSRYESGVQHFIYRQQI